MNKLARALLRPISGPAAATERAADAVVVFGAPPGHGRELAAPLAERIAAGADIYRRGLARVVCATGTPAEAAAMQTHLLGLGVASDDLRIDADARSTRDNARNASSMLAADNCRTVWVVTQAFHRRRACFWLRRFGLDARAWPIAGEAPPRLWWIAREYAAWGRVIWAAFD